MHKGLVRSLSLSSDPCWRTGRASLHSSPSSFSLRPRALDDRASSSMAWASIRWSRSSSSLSQLHVCLTRFLLSCAAAHWYVRDQCGAIADTIVWEWKLSLCQVSSTNTRVMNIFLVTIVARVQLHIWAYQSFSMDEMESQCTCHPQISHTRTGLSMNRWLRPLWIVCLQPASASSQWQSTATNWRGQRWSFLLTERFQ